MAGGLVLRPELRPRRRRELRGRILRSQDRRAGVQYHLPDTPVRLPVGPLGPKDDTCAQGPQGPQGIPGVSGYEVVENPIEVQPGGRETVVAQCPTGKKVIGGGADGFDMYLIESAPTFDRTGWIADAHNGDVLSDPLKAYAICATVN